MNTNSMGRFLVLFLLINTIQAHLLINQLKSVAKTQLEGNNDVLRRLIIDLRTQITSNSSVFFQLKESNQSQFINNSFISSSRLHSNQINDTFLSQIFTISNKTNILINKSSRFRSNVCSNIKYCEKLSEKMGYEFNYECVLNLNLILYMSSQSTSKSFNELKIVKLDIILNNFKYDRINFKKFIYEFSYMVNSSVIGKVEARLSVNKDLNELIKYYIEFKDEDRRNMIDLFKINENTGVVSINRTVLKDNFKNSYEFYVDALIQCSRLQKPLHNRTLVRINLMNNKTKPIVRITNLIEIKQLGSIECIRLNNSDLNTTNSIALTQVQIDFNNPNDNALIEIDSIESNYFNNKSNGINVELRHLIDNIYVVYLVNKNRTFSQLYLTDIYKINLRIISNSQESIIHSIYICINHLSASNNEELSLIKFSSNMLNELYLDKMASNQASLELQAYNLVNSSSKNIQYILDSTEKNLTNYFIENNQLKLNYSIEESNNDSIEILQRELTCLAYDNDKTIETKFRLAYANLSQLSRMNNKLLSFTSKIFLNAKSEFIVNDYSIYSGQLVTSNYDEKNVKYVYKFYTKFESLVNNSIIGYLPNVYEMNKILSRSSTNIRIETFFYRLSVNDDCFKLNKFDGVLTYENQNLKCNLNKLDKRPVVLNVVLEPSRQITFQIEVHNVMLMNRMTSNELNFLKINSNSANFIYESTNSSLNQNKEFNLNFKLNFDAKNMVAESILMPESFKLINLISNVEHLKTKYDLVHTEDSSLFLFDSKKNSIYLNMSNELDKKLEAKNCYTLEFLAKNYAYLNSIKRELKSYDNFKMNLCFIQGEPSFKDLHAFKYLSPITAATSIGSFDFLIQKTSKSFVNSTSFLCFILLASFLLISIVLTLFVTYLYCVKRQNSKHGSNQHLSTTLYNYDDNKSVAGGIISSLYQISPNEEQMTSNFNSTLSTPSSSNTDSSSQLRIRNDLSNIYTEVKTIPTKQSHINDCMLFNSAFEVSTIIKVEKESSEDQGIYCVATGLSSYSLSSNFSSVTNSQCVDGEDIDDSFSRSIQSEDYSQSDYEMEENRKYAEQTRLSLFNLTPSQLSAKKRPIDAITFNKRFDIDNELHKWIFINYNINCKQTNRAKIVHNYQSQTTTSTNQIDSINECII